MIERLGPPPLNAVGGVSWANRAAQILLHLVLTDEHMPLGDRLRHGRELIGVVGLTHAKALVDERLAALERRQQLDDEEAADEDLDPIQPAAERPADGDRGEAEEQVPRPLPGTEGPEG
jgi:hypothetical protein